MDSMLNRMTMIPLTCKHCGNSFIAINLKGPTPKLCSLTCKRLQARQRVKNWCISNPERSRLAHQKWKQKNKDRIANYRKQWTPEQRAMDKARVRKWRSQHPDKFRENNRLQYQRRRTAIGKLTMAEWKLIKAIFQNRCAYCWQVRPLEIEHVIPLSKGGANTAENVVPACSQCNRHKWNRTLEQLS